MFFLCRKDWLEKGEVHFDARQQQIIDWEHQSLPADMERLKASIRVAVPEAKQTD